MTITGGPEGMPYERDGVTYYFCSGGCRQAFENEPAAHPSGS
jgi:YHS domain-containing protein